MNGIEGISPVSMISELVLNDRQTCINSSCYPSYCQKKTYSGFVSVISFSQHQSSQHNFI